MQMPHWHWLAHWLMQAHCVCYRAAVYWQERWEVYRITYVFSQFLALNGVANIEVRLWC